MKVRNALLNPKMILMLAFGFSSGLPYLISRDILKAWMTESHVDLTTIGLFSGLSIPYTLKFLWAPLMDRYSFKFLGRRRGWMLISQIGLLISIFLLGQFDPNKQLLWIAILAMAVAFFGASQDIVIDAHRREYLLDSELGFGSAVYMNAYRGANLLSLAVAFLLSDRAGYAVAHMALAAFVVVGMAGVLFSKEPKVTVAPPRTLKEAVVGPFLEFFQRPGAWTILAFILLYKLGDNLAFAMNVPFILSLGFSKTDYLVIVKGLGMFSLFGGMLVGGATLARIGLFRSLVGFGLLQMVSIGFFGFLAVTGKNTYMLTVAVIFELFSAGLGTTAYSTFMALQTNTRFTATQYALMTSLMALPGTLAAMVTGKMAESFGWMGFYFTCMATAIPGLILIWKVCPRETNSKPAKT